MRIGSAAVVTGLVVLALGGAGCLPQASDEAGAGHVRSVGELRLLSEQIRNQAGRALVGDGTAYDELDASNTRLGQSLAALEADESESPAGVEQTLSDLGALSQEIGRLVSTVSQSRAAAERWQTASERLSDLTNELLETADELALAAVEENLPQQQVYIATRQLMLLERIRAQSLEARFARGEEVVKAMDRLGRDANLLSRVSDGFVSGDAKLQLTRLEAPAANEDARRLAAKMKTLVAVVTDVMESAPDAFRARESLVSLDERAGRLSRLLESLQAQYEATPDA